MRMYTSGIRHARTGIRTSPILRNRAVATAPGCTAVSTSPSTATRSAGWNVEKFINVAAATGRHSSNKTITLIAMHPADGGPDAIIGGLPPADSVAESLQLVDRQMSASRFCGVRPMGRLDQPLPAVDVLRGLAERNLVFE